MSDAAVLMMLTPVIAAVIGRIFLNEPLGRYEIIAMVLSLIGIICISRPESIFGMTEEEKLVYQSKDRIIGMISGICQGILGGIV